MMCIMRTTISIDENLLAAAKEQALLRRQTLSGLLEDALRAELGRHRVAERPTVPIFTEGSGPRPGVDVSSNRAIHDALDEDAPLEVMR